MTIALTRAPLRAFSRPARWLAVSLAALSLAVPALAHAANVNVVAAENFYGDVASQIGGRHVTVTSILSSPDQDPHMFEASPKTARALQQAQLVIYNGADYDPWMAKLLGASKQAKRATIVVADLVGKKAGDNPHLWYDPAAMPAAARAIAAELGRADPANQADYDANLRKFIASLKPVHDRIAALRAQYKGVPVTATEPVLGYLADAIGLEMRNQRFQLSTMNDTEVSASDIAAFEKDLRNRQVRVLI